MDASKLDQVLVSLASLRERARIVAESQALADRLVAEGIADDDEGES